MTIDDKPITDYLKQYNKLLKQANPNINELKNFLETNQHHEQTFGIQALELKYQSMTTVPTTIEKTMSPYQLYATNNPLWTVELSALKIETFLDLEKNTGKLSKAVFNRAYNYETNNVFIDTETYDSPTIQFNNYFKERTPCSTVTQKC